MNNQDNCSKNISLISTKSKEDKIGETLSDFEIPHRISIHGGVCYEFFKRVFDVFNSLLALIILSPLMIIISLIIMLTSKGPAIYKSKRVGKNGKVFWFYKFRSMYYNAENDLEKLKEKNEIEGGVTFKMQDDPRITPFGKFLRKTSIDELPQLINILKNDMSIIGPRPALPDEVRKYSDKAKDRLLVKQGLSGEWQTHGRSNTSFEQMIDMDLDYIQNKRSFLYDLKLIFKTIGVVILGKGAK